MRIHDVEQGSPEWFASRLGIPTASEFDKIITPTGKRSTQYEAYANRLLAELMCGHAVETFEGNSWTARGTDLEPQAVGFYELQTGADTLRVGFCTDDARTMGASPDRLIGDDGLLEIKCPAPHTHVQYLLDGEIDRKYYPQIQGQLLITGRRWVDWMSFHPEMPPVIIRVPRDEPYLFEMTKLLGQFHLQVKTKREHLINLGHMERSQ